MRAPDASSSRLPPSALCAGLGRSLLAWYRRSKRDLPWRDRPDPYAIWVSEIMLQQTQVDTVVPYFQRWMARFPDIATLAEAPEDDVLTMWQGLGYYSRARALRRCARQLTDIGEYRLPRSVAALRALPGIGPYTAGAIASIAYGEHEPVVDGNVTRVLTRLFRLNGDPAREPLKGRLWSVARALLVPGHAGDTNQAMMELGALVCKPKAPRCERCPLSRTCAAHANGSALAYPERKARAAVTEVRAAAALLLRRGRALVVRFPDDAPRWASMWHFPSVEHHPDEPSSLAACRAVLEWTGLAAQPVQLRDQLRHSVTRYRIQVEFHEVTARGRPRCIPGSRAAWLCPSELHTLAMPAAHQKLARRLIPR